MAGAGSKLRKAARNIIACGSFSRRRSPVYDPASFDSTIWDAATPPKEGNFSEVTPKESDSIWGSENNLCAICLDPLDYRSNKQGKAIFTAQCSHAFHLACISSNVRHGSVTCPICRSHWTRLPRTPFNQPCKALVAHHSHSDPILQILDDSIASLRFHRRSFLRFDPRHEDDNPPLDPPDHTQARNLMLEPPHSRLHLSLVSSAVGSSSLSPSQQQVCPIPSSKRCVHLSVRLARNQQATDLVLVATPTVPHLRLLKQSMALVVLSLQPMDRLAIVTYSSAAARAFPLRRMTSYGKRTALQAIDRLFYTGQADDPAQGLNKAFKIVEDRSHKNPHSCVLHLLDSPSGSYCHNICDYPVPIHRFHVGFGFGTPVGHALHEFQEFLMTLLKGEVREVQLRIGEGARMIGLGDLRGNEERRITLNLGDCNGRVRVSYSYLEGGCYADECTRTEEAVLRIEKKRDRGCIRAEEQEPYISARASSADVWDHHDRFVAMRWAKHLHHHGYRL